MVKFLRDIRLFAYITLISFEIQLFLGIGNDLVSGNTNEATFYKAVSFVMAAIALFSLKAMYDMWQALRETTEDIQKLKEKGHLDPRLTEPTQVYAGMRSPTGTMFGPISDEEIAKMTLLENILKKKSKNEPSN